MKKKLDTVNNDPIESEKCTVCIDVIKNQYETLRKGALGVAISIECRKGLVILLRQGMWEWAKSLAIASAQVTFIEGCRTPAVQCSNPLIDVFTDMILNVNYRSIG